MHNASLFAKTVDLLKETLHQSGLNSIDQHSAADSLRNSFADSILDSHCKKEFRERYGIDNG